MILLYRVVEQNKKKNQTIEQLLSSAQSISSTHKSEQFE